MRRSSARPLGLTRRHVRRVIACVLDQGGDRYGRTLGRVTCGTHEANTKQVRRGMAWVFVRYARKVRRMLHGPTSAFQSRR